ncbi:UxaA family hydrolase [Paenibacillus sp. J5C_2022]|nr:UxaA family hydrolase [Paenibacillus sp. J5C2022]
MSHTTTSVSDAIVMDMTDHVATALRDMKIGEEVHYKLGTTVFQIQLLDDVAFGHKFAILDIDEGWMVRKYGEIIGRATVPIAKGKHVHIHNIEGIRGRGDQAEREASQ